MLDNNIIMKTMRESQAVKNAKPMTYQNVFKLFENMMDQKYEVDKKDLKDRRVPRTMTEFLMEYL